MSVQMVDAGSAMHLKLCLRVLFNPNSAKADSGPTSGLPDAHGASPNPSERRDYSRAYSPSERIPTTTRTITDSAPPLGTEGLPGMPRDRQEDHRPRVPAGQDKRRLTRLQALDFPGPHVYHAQMASKTELPTVRVWMTITGD